MADHISSIKMAGLCCLENQTIIIQSLIKIYSYERAIRKINNQRNDGYVVEP